MIQRIFGILLAFALLISSAVPALSQSAGTGCSTTNRTYFPSVSNDSGLAFVCDGTTLQTLATATASPLQLEINGKLKVDTFAAASATTVCSNANVLSTCSSSIRYKEKVKDAQFGLKEVMAMRPVTFKWKGRDENDLGLIAEEVAKINPLFVTYERGQIEGVKYPQLTAILANAIKQQQEEMKNYAQRSKP